MDDRVGGSAATRVRIARWLVCAAVLVGSAAGRAEAAVPACIGDCDTNRHVTVDELVRGVNIALGALATNTCATFDRNRNGAVTIDELIAGVNSALQGCYPATFRGLCRLPGAAGLIPCAAGTSVRLSRCLDRGRCLFDASVRRLLGSGVTAADGRFALFLDDPDLLDGLLLLETDVGAGVTYRSLVFGPATVGAVVDNLDSDPRWEAIARLLNLNGLDLFSDASLRELIDIILAALANLDFAGLTPDAAATLATTAAGQDPTVQSAIDARRFTPTPVAPTATATRTPTITETPTRSATPTASLTATPTPTVTDTFTATPTRTFTATATLTFTATATPTVTLTPTPSSTPTATLPPLNLAIEVNPDPVRPGETIDATFTISNTGGSTIQGLTLTATLPMAIDPFLDNLLTPGGRCGVQQINTCNPGGTMTWGFLGSLAPGEGITLHAPPILSVGTPNGTAVGFTAQAVATGLQANASYAAVVQSAIGFPYDLALEQDADPVPPGATLTYTVVYGFRAVVGQADTVLRLHPPAGTSVVAASDGGAPVAGGDIEWALGTLTPGDGGVRRLTVQVDPTAAVGTLLPAQVVIQRADTTGAKRASSVGRVQASQALRLAVETAPDPARPGETIDEAVTITNPTLAGVSATLDVVVPDFVDAFADTTTLGGGICGPFSLGNACERRARVRFPINVPPRDGVTVHLNPFVSAATQNGGVVRFRAYLLNAQGLNVATARSAVHVETAPAWELTLDEDRDPVGATDAYTYQLTVRRRPAAGAADGVLSLALPSEATLLSASDGGALMDGSVHWDLGTVAAGAAVRRAVSVQVGAGVAPASVLAAEAVVVAANDPAAATRVRALTRTAFAAPLLLSAVIDPDPVKPGATLGTELTVTNTGNAPLNGLRIEARLPDGVDAFSQGQSAGASCSPTTLQCAPREVARWTIGGVVPAGGSATVRMPPIVSAGTADGSLLHLQFRATDLGGGPSEGRSAVLGRTAVVETAPVFDLAVTAAPDPVTPGQMLAYTLHFGRLAAGSAAAVLRLQLPPNVYVVSASDGGVAVGDDAAEWALGALAAGEEGSVELTAVVDAVAPGTALHARATLRDGADAASEARAEVVTTAGTSPLAFAVSATPDPVQHGHALTVSLAVTNNGASAVGNLTVEAVVPDEAMAFLDNTTTGGGICGPFSFNNCQPGQRVLWPIAVVNPGQTVTVTMPPTIRADVPAGTVIRLVGRLVASLGGPPVHAATAVTVN